MSQRWKSKVAAAIVPALVGALLARSVFAKHPSNAGPTDPPIRFPLPPPAPLSPEQEMKTFKLQPGFRIELAAAEPLVEDPVQIAFDEKGRMWVVEMRGYMHTLEGGGEREPTGRIKILESTKHDGNFDRATIFLDRLLMPRSVLPIRGGALVAEPPNLYFVPEQDGKPGERTIVATNYGTRGGQPEHMANGLALGLDNWVYSANYTDRARYMGGKWQLAGDRGRGQWGLTKDDFGRLYFNYNEDLLRCDVLPAEYFLRNAYWPGAGAANARIIHDNTVWPGHPTLGVNRGYEAAVLRDDGSLRAVTATCGPFVYRGALFPAEYLDNVFICEPAGNLVKRVIVGESQGTLKAQNAYYGAEFLTSTDERCRPVNLSSGPDGALYVVDMYRGVIEHERYLTNYLIKNIEQRKLVAPIHRGRIYRIVPAGSHPMSFTMPRETEKLIDCLAHADGWVRDTAQRLLVGRHDPDTVDLVIKVAAGGPTPLARLHALWTLQGMNQMTIPIAQAALGDRDAHVRATGVRMCEPFLVPATRSMVLPQLLALTHDADPTVRLQLLLTLGPVDNPKAENAIISIVSTSPDILSDLLRDSTISGLRGRELALLERLLASPASAKPSPTIAGLVAGLGRCIFLEHRAAPTQRLLDLAANQPGDGQWRTSALLKGMTEPVPGSLRRTPKLIYLDRKPAALARLLENPDSTIRQMAAKLDQRVAWPEKPGVAPPPQIVPLTAMERARFEKGKLVYANVCAACHQPSGLGQEGLAPPLLDSEWLLGPPARTVRIVLQGVSGPIKVDGAQYNLEMPGLATLGDEEVADVLTYARREWEHGADPVAPELVGALRQQTRERGNAWTASELLGIK